MDEIYVGDAFSSPSVDELLNAEDIELYQSAIRGRKEDDSQLSLSGFMFKLNTEKQPKRVNYPHR